MKVGALGSQWRAHYRRRLAYRRQRAETLRPGSNGTLNFVANVTISSGTDAILAANTITIQPTWSSTSRERRPAQVFTNNPNYSGFGGNNPGNGTFGGNGANNPLPLNQAPPFDGPPGGNRR